jgi:hypothetical protein
MIQQIKSCTAKTLYRKFETNIPRNETAQQNRLTDRGIYKSLTDTYMNVEIENKALAVSFLGIHKSDLVCSVVQYK